MQPRIEHPQDTDRDYDFAVLDAQGDAEDVTGWAFAFTVWNDVAETPAKLFELTSGAGEIVVDILAEGIGRIRVMSSLVGAYQPGRYRFEFSRTISGGSPDVLESGTFILTRGKPAN